MKTSVVFNPEISPMRGPVSSMMSAMSAVADVSSLSASATSLRVSTEGAGVFFASFHSLAILISLKGFGLSSSASRIAVFMTALMCLRMRLTVVVFSPVSNRWSISFLASERETEVNATSPAIPSACPSHAVHRSCRFLHVHACGC